MALKKKGNKAFQQSMQVEKVTEIINNDLDVQEELKITPSPFEPEMETTTVELNNIQYHYKRVIGTEEWELFHTANLFESRATRLHQLNDKNIMKLSTKKNKKGELEEKVQSGIYIEQSILTLTNYFVRCFSDISPNSVIFRGDVIDNILYDFMSRQKLLKSDDPSFVVKNYDRIYNLNERLMKKIYQKDIRSVNYRERSNQNLYMRLNVYKPLVSVAQSLYYENEGGKANFPDMVLKSWFIDNKIVPENFFCESIEDRKNRLLLGVETDWQLKTEKAVGKFRPEDFKAYFDIENRIYDDRKRMEEALKHVLAEGGYEVYKSQSEELRKTAEQRLQLKTELTNNF